MQKKKIFDQKNNAKKKKKYRPTYPIFFRTVTGNKQFLFLGLSCMTDRHYPHCDLYDIQEYHNY